MLYSYHRLYGFSASRGIKAAEQEAAVGPLSLDTQPACTPGNSCLYQSALIKMFSYVLLSGCTVK